MLNCHPLQLISMQEVEVGCSPVPQIVIFLVLAPQTAYSPMSSLLNQGYTQGKRYYTQDAHPRFAKGWLKVWLRLMVWVDWWFGLLGVSLKFSTTRPTSLDDKVNSMIDIRQLYRHIDLFIQLQFSYTQSHICVYIYIYIYDLIM